MTKCNICKIKTKGEYVLADPRFRDSKGNIYAWNLCKEHFDKFFKFTEEELNTKLQENNA